MGNNNQVKIAPLYEGTFSVGTDYIFNRINKSDPPQKNALKLSIHPFLIRDNEKNILFDAGLGDLYGAGTSVVTMRKNLDQQGLTEFDIHHIFISHLHFDHFAGLGHRENGYWELTFPDAEIWVSENGWKKLAGNIDEQSEEKQDFFYFLDSKADLRFVEDGDTPVEHVRVSVIGGHTEHHLALYYENGDNRFVMAGDVIGRRISINQSFAAKYDFAPKQSMKAREQIKKLAYEQSYVILAYHETNYPLFKLTNYEEKKGYTVKTIDYEHS